MLFSKQTNGFYDEDVHVSVPDDAVEISEDRHKELLEGQSKGQLISSDDRGFPILVNKPEPSGKELLEINNKKARTYLNSTDWYVIRKMETGVEIPADVLTARATARLSIVE